LNNEKSCATTDLTFLSCDSVSQKLPTSALPQSNMEKFDWKLTIRVNILMLQLVGLWPKGDEIYKRNLYTLYAITSTVLIMGGHNFFQAMNIFFVYNDLEALAGTFFITVTDLLASVKMYFFVQNIGLLKELMMTLNCEIFQPKTRQQIDLVRPGLTIWKMTYVTFWVMVGATTTLMLVFPFFNNSLQQKQLPFAAWYPFSTKKSPFYEVAYLYQAVGMWYLTVANVNMDTLIAALMMYVGTQCDILCDDLKNLQDLSDTKNIVKCVNHHREIVRYVVVLREFISRLLKFDLFLVSLKIAINSSV
jgi:hypothetical protein